MEINHVIGQRLAGVIGAIIAKSFTTHEEVARQLEGIAATARAYHANDLAKQPLIQPLPNEGEESLDR